MERDANSTLRLWDDCTATVQTAVVSAGVGASGLAPLGNALPTQPEPAKRAAHYLWAVLIARIYEVFPLLCPLCGGQMRIITFITHSASGVATVTGL